MTKNSDKKESVLKFIVEETLESFQDIKDLKLKGEQFNINYDYEITRDRKAALMLKAILAEAHLEHAALRRLELGNKVQQLTDNS